MPDNANPQAKPDPNEKLVKVFDTEQEAEAMVVQGLLDAAGITSNLQAGLNQDAFPGLGGVQLFVNEEDAADAAKVIESYRQSPPLDDDETQEITG